MTRATLQRRPVDLTDAQVKDLAAGKSIGLGKTARRPRALTQKHIEALRKGHKVDLEKIPELEPIKPEREK
jgi:hypothetical protein